MRNSDFLRIQDCYAKKILVTEQEETPLVKPSLPSDVTPAQKAEAILEPLPKRSLADMKRALGISPMSSEEREEVFREAGKKGSGLSKFKREVVLETLEDQWNRNQEKHEAKLNKYHSLFLMGDLSSGKSSVVAQFAREKAVELGLDKAAYELYKKFPGVVEEETPYIDIEVIQQFEEVFNEFLKDPAKYFICEITTLESFSALDFRGIPDLSKTADLSYVKENKYGWLYALSQPGARGIFFLDEFNRAQEDVFNSALTLFLDHKIGGVKIRDNVLVVAAGNLATEGSGGSQGGTRDIDVYQALNSRIDMTFLVMDPFDWIKLAEKEGIDADIIDFVRMKPYYYLGISNQVGGKSEDEWLKGYDETKRGTRFPSTRAIERFDQNYKAIKAELEQVLNANRSNAQVDEKLLKRVNRIERRIVEKAQLSCGNSWAQDFDAFLRTKETFVLKNIANPTHEDYVGNLVGANAFKQYALPNFLLDEIKKAYDYLDADLLNLEQTVDPQSDPEGTSATIKKWLHSLTPEKQQQYQNMIHIVTIFKEAGLDTATRMLAKMKRPDIFPQKFMLFLLRFVSVGLDPVNSIEKTLQRDFQQASNKAAKNMGSYKEQDDAIKAKRATK
jgi:hypothetical protein